MFKIVSKIIILYTYVLYLRWNAMIKIFYSHKNLNVFFLSTNLHYNLLLLSNKKIIFLNLNKSKLTYIDKIYPKILSPA